MNRRSCVELFCGAFAAGVLLGISPDGIKGAGRMKSPGNESELCAEVVIAGQEQADLPPLWQYYETGNQ